MAAYGAGSKAAADIADVATQATPLDEFRAAAMAVLGKAVAFDYGIVWSVNGTVHENPHIVGFPTQHWQTFVDGSARYAPDVEKLFVLASGRAVRDSDVYTPRDRDRLVFYQEIIRPVGSREFITAVMTVASRPVAALQIGRGRGHGSSFSDRDVDTLSRALSSFALGEAVRSAPFGLRSERPRPQRPLSPRERETLGLLLTGAPDKEIALRLNLSLHTVRQYVKTVYRAYEVHSRAELLARLR